MIGQAAQPRVLVLEGDSILAGLIKRLLEPLDFEVVWLTPEEAGKQYVPEDIDLMVVDLDGPAVNRGPLLERLSELYPLASVIVITQPDGRGPERWLSVGAVIQKPFPASALIEKIRDGLNQPKPLRRCRPRAGRLGKSSLPPRGLWGGNRCVGGDRSTRTEGSSSASFPPSRREAA